VRHAPAASTVKSTGAVAAALVAGGGVGGDHQFDVVSTSLKKTPPHLGHGASNGSGFALLVTARQVPHIQARLRKRSLRLTVLAGPKNLFANFSSSFSSVVKMQDRWHPAELSLVALSRTLHATVKRPPAGLSILPCQPTLVGRLR
jgi:hypothetical protein